MCKVFQYKNGCTVTVSRVFPSGYFTIRLYDANDGLVDKVLTDTLQPSLRDFRTRARTGVYA